MTFQLQVVENSGFKDLMVENSGAEKSMVEMSGYEKSMIENPGFEWSGHSMAMVNLNKSRGPFFTIRGRSQTTWTR